MKRLGTYFLAALVGLLCATGAAQAQKNARTTGQSQQVTVSGNYDEAINYFNQGDYASALRVAQPLSDRGDPDSQGLLAYMYEFGLGVPMDYGQAFNLYKKAADQGYAYAQNGVGLMYRDGKGTMINAGESIRWFQAAADQGNIDAQHNVGYAYEHGLGVSQDVAQAAEWYKLAADQGYMWSQNALGYLYDVGNGVTQSYDEAVRWYRAAADQGLAVAQSNLGTMYDYGLGVAEDDAEAARWWQLAADQNYAQALNNLGNAYDQGRGVTQDKARAAEFYRAAADQGLAVAQNNLGFAYEVGAGVPQSFSEAVHWYRLAADQNLDYGLDNLGFAYYSGNGVPQSYSEAVRLWQQAADLGFANSQKNLGVVYELGQGVPQDDNMAFYYYEMAANQGNLDAQLNLAEAYENGQGTERNVKLAADWYETLKKSGNQEYVDLGNERLAALDLSAPSTTTPAQPEVPAQPDETVVADLPVNNGPTTPANPLIDPNAQIREASENCSADVSGRIRTSETRVALVIGNSAYEHATALPNPTCDAEAMAQMLEHLGFEVIYGTDLSKTALEAKAREFAQKAQTASTTLFFYAGHGLQVDGRNYMVPTDAVVADATAINFELVDMETVTQFMTGYDQATGRERVAVVLLDACRNNPFQAQLKRSLGASRSTNLEQGLAQITTGGGMIIGFATSPGDVASDGTGNHSPFTAALLENLASPGIEFQTVMTRVKAKVVQLTSNQPKPQRPWTNSDLTSEFYLAPTA
jgi:TPR repeat protein